MDRIVMCVCIPVDGYMIYYYTTCPWIAFTFLAVSAWLYVAAKMQRDNRRARKIGVVYHIAAHVTITITHALILFCAPKNEEVGGSGAAVMDE